MDKVVHIFNGKDDADRFDRDIYRAMTPQQRVDILLQLVNDSGPASEMFERVCRVERRQRTADQSIADVDSDEQVAT